MKKIKFKKILIKNQWQDNVTLVIDKKGLIAEIMTSDAADAPDDQQIITSYALPGMPNIHSHAFQRAMAGLTEYATSGKDNFWTWRDAMYRFAQIVTPDDLYHIARQLYLEMAMAGYTSVAEFHYLHHQPGGQPYDNPAEMSLALMRAAADVGLGLTLLPVLYMSSGFGGLPLNAEQARFGHTLDQYCHLLSQLYDGFKDDQNQNLGVAFHSLRAVPTAAFDEVIQHMDSLDAAAPLHIHIAEQRKEVEDCTAWSGQRPVEWLLNHQELSARWCLVHATHLTTSEGRALAKSGAVAGLCPTTEANLGDGLFPLKAYLQQGGSIAIGSDSHISISPIEELRLLEYGQRLMHQSRNIAATTLEPHAGTGLYLNSLAGGSKAAGFNTGEIAVGKRADLITLDPGSARLFGTPDDFLLDRFIFSGNLCLVKDVMMAGHWQVKDGIHPKAAEITSGFHNVMNRMVKILD